jgi:polar amino acid transport system substrate-binding protein
MNYLHRRKSGDTNGVHMKRLSFLCALFGVLFPLHVVATCERVIISAHPNYAPFHWAQGDSLTGASIHTATDILNHIGVPWEVQHSGPWKRVLKEAYNGNIDLIPALKRTPERETYLTFTHAPFFDNPVSVFRTRGSEPINDLQALDGLIGSINAGDKHGSVIDTFLAHQDVIQVKGIQESFQMLDRGRVDYFVIGDRVARSFLKENNLEDKFVKVFKLTGAQVHFAFSKQSPCAHLTSSFDKYLVEMNNDNTIHHFIEMYNDLWLQQRLDID